VGGESGGEWCSAVWAGRAVKSGAVLSLSLLLTGPPALLLLTGYPVLLLLTGPPALLLLTGYPVLLLLTGPPALLLLTRPSVLLLLPGSLLCCCCPHPLGDR
ncbi:hypothetical protein, partial [Halobacterium salinarum]|uniref:hypothetical protein n=1 Tax=Halobacterium salinarum TaxID=2242 RepID=UPI001F24B576